LRARARAGSAAQRKKFSPADCTRPSLVTVDSIKLLIEEKKSFSFLEQIKQREGRRICRIKKIRLAVRQF
jgi:hypothetical protein